MSDFTHTVTTTQGQIIVRKPQVAWEGPGSGVWVEPNGERVPGLCSLHDDEAYELAIALLIAAGMDDAADAAAVYRPDPVIHP